VVRGDPSVITGDAIVVRETQSLVRSNHDVVWFDLRVITGTTMKPGGSCSFDREAHRFTRETIATPTSDLDVIASERSFVWHTRIVACFARTVVWFARTFAWSDRTFL
jgi:hypothetical protein